MRMRGYNVLFPMAFHYTGTPILAMSKRLEAGDQDLIDTFTRIYKVSVELLKEFAEPMKIASYFHQEIKQGMREMGYSIDWRREFTTVDSTYKRFIEWQFHKLAEKNLITQGSHPVGWCPSCGNPVGQHDTVGDVEPEIGGFIVIKFIFKDSFMPTATLRPETIFGVTNIWIHPDADYVRCKVNGENWVVSKRCAEKLSYQGRDVKVLSTFKGSKLIGDFAENPVNEAKIPILPASFVDPGNATGVVMSVPGHAPYDYQALVDLRASPDELAKHSITMDLMNSVHPISIIRLEGYSELPALDAIQRLGVKNQSDPKLDNATKDVYSHEFHRGVMKENTLKYVGLSVAEAKDRVKDDLAKVGRADGMYEFLNKHVVCRCGAECVVKIFEKQWFINYGNSDWKAEAHKCLENMSIMPEDVRSEFNYTVDWLKEKACARKSGLGTELPWDKSWVIESLSDSTIYMAYYIVSKYITQHRLTEKQLTKEVFDYIFLGQGEPEKIAEITGLNIKLLEAMHSEFEHFYPLDCRHSGRDLIPNHLTFFMFNHTAIFPRSLWPRQIVVNGSVLMEGKKMSKSYGNIIPLREAINIFGADALRLAVISTAELLQDADFSTSLAKSIREKLEHLYDSALDVIKLQGEGAEGKLKIEDRWLLTRLQQTVKNVTESMEKLKVREAIQQALYLFDRDLQWYMRRLSAGKRDAGNRVVARVLKDVLDTRIRLLAPFAPYICEEIWQKMGGESFVSTASWPTCDGGKIDVKAEELEEMVRNMVEDTNSIVKATGIKPSRLCYYVASGWKWKVYLKVLEKVESEEFDVSSTIRELLTELRPAKDAKRLSDYVRRLAEEFKEMPPELRRRRLRIGVLEEYETLLGAVEFYNKMFDAETSVYREEDPEKYDPKSRAAFSQPHRPAIYVE